MVTPMDRMHIEAPALLRLMQLASPGLPVGGFSYSQGLEWAVQAGWVSSEETLSDWLRGLLDDGFAYLDAPVFARLYRDCEAHDLDSAQHWVDTLLAARETAELREEESRRGRALATLLKDLEVLEEPAWFDTVAACQAGGFAKASVKWRIPLEQAALGYAWTWLENQVVAAIKLVPLGQTAGQRVLLQLGEHLAHAIAGGLLLGDDDIGACAPALAIASSCHETQYTRLFRS